MALTFNFAVNDKPNKAGLFTIFLVLKDGKQLKRVKVTPEVTIKSRGQQAWGSNKEIVGHWNFDKQEVRKADPDYKAKNDTLKAFMAKYVAKYEQLEKEGRGIIDNIVNEIDEEDKHPSFLKYATKVVEEYNNNGQLRVWKKYNGFLNKLKAYLATINKEDLLFVEVTPKFMKEFEAYLHTLHNEREPEKLLHQNTIAQQFCQFQAIINRAITDKEMMPQDSPFLSFHCTKLDTKKGELDKEELDALIGLNIEEGCRRWDARNIWLFMFYLGGIRVGDALQLRWSNIKEGRLTYRMDKNKKEVSYVIVEPAQEILGYYSKKEHKENDYVFPFMDGSKPWAKFLPEERSLMPIELKKPMLDEISAKTSIINNKLRVIAKEIGTSIPLTCHIARHTFASYAQRQGVSATTIKGMLKHTNLQTTQKYLASDESKEADKNLLMMFNKQEEAKTEEEKLLEQLQGIPQELLAKVLQKMQMGV